MIYIYDGTYPGLLTVIFETYRLRAPATRIIPTDRWTEELFAEPTTIDTKDELAARVLKGVEKRAGTKATTLLYRCYLSEREDLELLIYHFVQRTIAEPENPYEDFGDEKILRLHQIDKQIGREVHRMHAFVRFQELKDGTYAALIEPDFNVLPLLEKHFRTRYPAMNWLIYDTKRHYGLHWDTHNAAFVTFPESEHQRLRQLSTEVLADQETEYQLAWQTYFRSVDIPERRNIKLHLQHVPRRYWRYLTEKTGD